MQATKINIAIVEDNGVARINLRNLLMGMGFSDVGCYSHGRELKSVLRQRHYDLVLMDFHLGLHKNGVEVVNELQQEGLIKPSTCIIFITSDRFPVIIGQIFDVHPDALVLKPYTIRNLEKSLMACIQQNRYLLPVLKLMDQEQNQQALELLDEMLKVNERPKYQTPMVKLKARLLVRLERYAEGAAIYEGILKTSDKILWAKWGLIQCTYKNGEVEKSEKMLEALLDTHLTNDKACEWLTRINIERKEYDKAQQYIDRIKESELSVSAALLKANLYQMRDEVDMAIGLLEKKRESNRNFRERYYDITMDLARVYLDLAEQKPQQERSRYLQLTRFLIGSAARGNQLQDVDAKRNYLAALAALMEEDNKKAAELLADEAMLDTQSMDASTLSDAVSAWHGLGNDCRASEMLLELEQKLKQLPDENERTITSLKMAKNEELLGEKRARAVSFNQQGQAFYVKNQFSEAKDLFYQAYILFPDEPAFSLNLLHCMAETATKEHKKASISALVNELQGHQLSAANANRFKDIKGKIRALELEDSN
ncbi:response regulator [Aliiglaciecola sp. CAU 1673]|uniref:response regulator n=1 Tax=Aliiglaciecola sp. CAU 1673 TaxID=3032595 RepID=UPI0023DB19F7|nr:response regulator [Aliiglaciecola sp. CAU 1673]MDF2177701.1 response regulator [Aliiglaciecola sp. CAU 1673]